MDRGGSARVAGRAGRRGARGRLPPYAAWAALYAALAASPLILVITGISPPPRGFAVELAAGLGYIALAMLSMQLVLGARPRGVVNAVGLDTFLLFHRAAGLWTAAFVIAHMALLVAFEPRFAAHLLSLRASPPHGAALWLALAGLALLVLMPRQLTRLRIPYEVWRVAHGVIAIAVLVIALGHVLSVGRSSATPVEQAAVMTLVVGAVAALLAARMSRPALALRRPWRVAEVRAEGARVWTLILEAIGHDGLSFRPGQSVWLTLGLSPYSPRQHPFTIASSAASPRRMELTIKELGDFTGDIGRTPVGTRAFLAGPYGASALDVHAQRPLVCVAGGIGITPMMSMIRTLHDVGDHRQVLLVYGVGSLDKMVFASELDELARAGDIHLVPVLESAPPGWTGERGVITRELLGRRLVGAFVDAEVFACGPEPMMNLVERALRDLGVRGDRIHTEHFAMVGSRPPGERSIRERHVRVTAGALALLLVSAAALVAAVRAGAAELSRSAGASRFEPAVEGGVLDVGLCVRPGALLLPGAAIARKARRSRRRCASSLVSPCSEVPSLSSISVTGRPQSSCAFASIAESRRGVQPVGHDA